MGRRGGFTLLELLMVVIIIAILASIALPQYLRVAERTRSSEALTILAAVRSSELRFRAQSPTNVYNDFPTTAYALDIDIPGYGGPPVPRLSTLWVYSVSGSAAGSNAVATRATGGPAGTIDIDLDTGDTCSSNAVYGLTVGTC